MEEGLHSRFSEGCLSICTISSVNNNIPHGLRGTYVGKLLSHRLEDPPHCYSVCLARALNV